MAQNDRHLDIIDKAVKKTKAAPSSVKEYIYIFTNGDKLESPPLSNEEEWAEIRKRRERCKDNSIKIETMVPVNYSYVDYKE